MPIVPAVKQPLNYTDVKKKLKIEVSKTADNGFAYLTHFFQNSVNGVSQHYRKPAIDHLAAISDKISNKEDLQIENLLPNKFNVPFPPTEKYDFTFIDLFAGIGGFRIPMQQEKGKCVFTCEFNFHAQRSYELNFGEIPFGDITQLNLETVPKHDILTAGFPCQPFSISGKMKGFEDTRGTLIYNVFKIIQMRNPKVVFLENVKHLLHHNSGKTLETIIMGLKGLGYKVSCEILNASDFGVPQNRERVIIIGHKTKLFDFDKINTKAKPILKDFLDTDGDFEYINEPFTILKDYKKQDSGLIFIGYRNKKIRKAGVRPGTENLSRVHKQPNRIYSTDGLHPALPSQETSGRFWIYHEGRVRKLTINECYKIMGFPDNFIKLDNAPGELYKQIGNSVCVPMIKAITQQIIKQLL